MVGVLALAFIVARACTKQEIRISDQEAVAIAKRQIDYKAERVQVRLVRRGVKSRPYWAVSLSQVGPGNLPVNITVVLVDARTKEVAQVYKGRI